VKLKNKISIKKKLKSTELIYQTHVMSHGSGLAT
jgi:hypothetical protein